MANQWFRMYAEFANDPKVQRLSEVEQRRFIMLLCMKCNGDATLHDDDIMFQLRISQSEWLETKSVLLGKKLIDINNNPVNWDKRQFVSDVSTDRSRACRERKKQNSPQETSLQQMDATNCNVAATPQNRTEQNRTDSDTEQNNKNVSKGERYAGKKPTGSDEGKRIAEKYLAEAAVMAAV